MTQSRLIARPIERWLQRAAPDQAVTLALVYAGMSETPVAAWSRAQFDAALIGELAVDLVNCAEDHAQGIGRECRYSLKWLDEEGAVVVAMTWRAGEGLNLNLDGTVESQLAQLQRHNEVQAKQGAQAIGALLDHYQEALSAAQLRIRALEEVRDAFELQRLAQVAEAGTEPQTEDQMDKLARTIASMAKITDAMTAAKLIGPGAAMKPPAKVEPS
jgi:hypothetical protein